MFFVYILYSVSLDRFYIGSTSINVVARLQKHLGNHSGYTAKANDWKIVFTEQYDNKSDALARELQLKNWKNKERLKQLISDATPG
ncbi:MAG: GIY-YIG nuclease family protein [Chitinophagaceae bacterium]